MPNKTIAEVADEIKASYESNADTNAYTDAEKAKLAGIEENATADMTGAEIKAAYEGEPDTNAYTDAEKAKLAGVEANATADMTGAEIKAAYEAEADTNAYTDAEKAKLAGIEENATADMTGAEIKAAYEGEADTNAYTDAEKAKLAGIEDNATADMTGAEIKTAYESNADTNAYTDAEKAALNDIMQNGVAAPYLSVEYAGARISIGATVATINTGTDFGDSTIGGNGVEHEFSIVNRGADDITLPADAASVAGAGFSVTQQPAAGVLAPDESAAFKLVFSPTSAGVANGTVSVASSDPVRSPFDFVVAGNGVELLVGGAPGEAGYGVCAPDLTGTGFEPLDAAQYTDPTAANFGNARHTLSGSIEVMIPAMGFKSGANPNEWSSAYLATYAGDVSAMEADGYILHEAFYAGGTGAAPNVVPVLAVDKYLCSKVAQGTGFVAASIKDGDPLSTSSDHNPVADITAAGGVNAYYAAVRAVKGRDSANGEYDSGSRWYVTTRQIQGLMQLISLCHGQAATSTTHCAWYDATGAKNYPRGCDNNALGSVDDASLSWVGDGYSNAAKTGSCSDPAKTSVNGQLCGVVELGGNMYQINLGMTRSSDQASDGSDTTFFVLKKHIDPASLDWGAGGPSDAWGTIASLQDRYDRIDIPALTHSSAWMRFGNGTKQVLPTNNNQILSLAMPVDANAISAGGTQQFGNDGIYLYHRSLLCVLSGLSWSNGSLAGVAGAHLGHARAHSYNLVGFRAACALSA